MRDTEVRSVWTVLQTEAMAEVPGLTTWATPVEVRAGPVLLGADHLGQRHLLIPLADGEAVAEDRASRGVHLYRLRHGGRAFLGVVCLLDDLLEVFTQFAIDLMESVEGASSPARVAAQTLAKWRRLLTGADGAGLLSEPRLVGLLAELLVLRELCGAGAAAPLDLWTGPQGSQHDFRSGAEALEVKGTLLREGRRVQINSVEQLEEPPNGRLHLVHHRFDRSPDGLDVPSLVESLVATGVDEHVLLTLLGAVGYRSADADAYRTRTYELVERRIYDVTTRHFPRITRASFVGGVTPPGTLALSYEIDLSNEPPSPLDDRSVDALLERMAAA